MSNIEATQVLGSPLPTGASQMGGDPYRTQLGGTTTCPVCKAATSLMDPYCGDCGFLLSSAANSSAEAPVEIPAESVSPAELTDDAAGRTYKLQAGVNTLGRQGTDILSTEGTVSRTHAKITVSDSGVTVEDLGSSNGSRVGDRKLASGEVVSAVSGDQLRFGNWKLRLTINDTAAAPAPDTRTIVVAEPTLMAAPQAVEPAVAEPAEEADANDAEPGSAPVVATLIKLEGPGDNISLTEGVVTFGRKAGNDLILADPYLSGKHGNFEVSSGTVSITDIGSTNGTTVNGTRLQADVAQQLVDGDELQLGQTRYRFETTVEDHASEGDAE